MAILYKLKGIGIIFSSRKQGNCTRCTEYCLDKMKHNGYDVESIEVRKRLKSFIERIINK